MIHDKGWYGDEGWFEYDAHGNLIHYKHYYCNEFSDTWNDFDGRRNIGGEEFLDMLLKELLWCRADISF